MGLKATNWTPQQINATVWYDEDESPLAAGGFLLQQDGVSKIFLQDGLSRLIQQ